MPSHAQATRHPAFLSVPCAQPRIIRLIFAVLGDSLSVAKLKRMNAARADLESLLRARKLDRSLASPTSPQVVDPASVASTGVAALDRQLGGGLPRGQWSELVGPRSSGRTRAVVSVLAAATARGELAALVDTFDSFDPVSAAAILRHPTEAGVGAPEAAATVPGAGPGVRVDWSRLLWVRGQPLAHVRPTTPGWRAGERGSAMLRGRTDDDADADVVMRALQRAVKAAAIASGAGVFSVVVLDVADVPPAVVSRLPFTTWLRLARMVEGRETAACVVAAAPTARSAGGFTLSFTPDAVDARVWRGTTDEARLFDRVASTTRAISSRSWGLSP